MKGRKTENRSTEEKKFKIHAKRQVMRMSEHWGGG